MSALGGAIEAQTVLHPVLCMPYAFNEKSTVRRSTIVHTESTSQGVKGFFQLVTENISANLSTEDHAVCFYSCASDQAKHAYT